MVHGRLDGELVPLLELALPLLPDLQDPACELMSHDGRILGHVVRDPLVGGALVSHLPGGHAQAVAYDLCQDFVILHFRKLEFLKPEVFYSI